MSSTEAPLLEPAPVVARRNPLSLLMGIIIKPRDTFAYLHDHGGWTWLWPLGLALAVTLVARIVAVPIERAQTAALQEQLEESGGDTLTVPFIEGGAPGGDALTAPSSNPLLDYGPALLRVIADWALAALVLFGVAWLFGGRPGFGAMWRMSGWALVPAIVRQGVAIGVMLATGRVPFPGLAGAFAAPVLGALPAGGAPPPGAVMIGAGPGGVLGGPSFFDLVWQNFLGAADVYTLWGLVLLGIGVAATARLAWPKAFASTLAYFVVALALSAVPTLLSLFLLPLMGGPMMVR